MNPGEMTMRYRDNRLVFAGIVSLMMSACIPYYGPEVRQFSPATRPEGIATALDLGSDTLQAEILALEEDALIVLVDRLPQHRLAGRLARVPFRGVRTVEFANADGFDYSFWEFFLSFAPPEPPDPLSLATDEIIPDSETHERLRLLSRYPQGLNAELLARLEGVYGEMETLDIEALGNRNR